jgi:serine/threonine-protein kinase RsbW
MEKKLSKQTNERLLNFSLPSTMKNITIAVEKIVNFCKEHTLNIPDFALRIALFESITNAIVHGNKIDPEKEIHISVSYNDKEIDIEIEDEGEGFDWEKQLMKEEVAPDHPHGRGFFLLEMYKFKVNFNEKGNKLMLKYLFQN